MKLAWHKDGYIKLDTLKTWTNYVYRIKSGRSSLLSLFCLCYVTISYLFLEFNIILIIQRIPLISA